MPVTQRYLQHVTLTTGHTRQSWAHEVSEDALRIVRALVDAAAVGGQPDIPSPEDARAGRHYTLTATLNGRCAIFTVWGLDTAPLATFAVAPQSKCGKRVWDLLHQNTTLPLVTKPDACPAEPWCGVRLEAGLAMFPQAAHWLGDFERCVAWAWMTRVEEKA